MKFILMPINYDSIHKRDEIWGELVDVFKTKKEAESRAAELLKKRCLDAYIIVESDHVEFTSSRYYPKTMPKGSSLLKKIFS
jgi:hypothetical protein